MKKFMIDMDDVLLSCRFLEYINEFFGTNYSIDDFTEYYIQNTLSPSQKAEFWQYMSLNNKDLYDGVELFPGVYDTLKKFNDILDIYVTTAYIWDSLDDISSNNLKNKYNCLRNLLPFLDPHKFIFIMDKSMLNFDIRLDDKVGNLANGETKMLFTGWHNKNIPEIELANRGIVRVNDWQEVDHVLSKKYIK